MPAGVALLRAVYVWSGGCAVEGAVRADGVVVVAEGVELVLEFSDRVGWGLGSEPFLQGLSCYGHFGQRN